MNWFVLFRFLFVFCNGIAAAMFQKRTVAEAPEFATGAKRMRAGLNDVFLGNKLSAAEVHYLAQAAHDAGVQHVRDIAKAAGNNTSSSSKKNMHRNILKAFTKSSRWPSLYYAPVRVWNPKTQQEEKRILPFMLPHEILHKLSQVNSLTALACQEGMAAGTKEHMAKSEAAMGLAPGSLIGFGLWGDGVPCNWDRSQSMDMWTLSLPGLPPHKSEFRLPLVAINLKYVVVENTMDDICSILAWSFQQCALGKMPAMRHNGDPFNQTDAKRKKLIGKDFPRAILSEVRGDWAWYKQCFRFPQHNELGGICFRCQACPATYRDCSLSADWRSQRLTHWQLLARFQEQGIHISPLFDCPFLRSNCFQLDWLHVADLGVSANFLGSLLLLFQTKYPGNNIGTRCSEMYLDLNQWYVDNGIESKLDQLTPLMLKPAKGFPHLRGKGAEVRALIPWAQIMAQRLLSDAVPLENTAKAAMAHLHACYNCLSHANFDSNVLQVNSRKFALLYVALEEMHPERWHVVPKLHMFQEMNEMSPTRPSCVWGYRDESFGGYLAGLCRLKGGACSPLAQGRTMLLKFQARFVLPVLA